MEKNRENIGKEKVKIKNVANKKRVEFRYLVYKYFLIFVLGCIIGYIYETILELLQTGTFGKKQELVYGPFATVYGIGILVFSIVASRIKNTSAQFLITAFFGGMTEYLYSFFQERFFGNISWDYASAVTNIDGRTTLLYAVGWGILGIIYIKGIYPLVNKLFEKIPKKILLPVTWGLIIFMFFNITITIFSSVRRYERKQNISPKNEIDVFYDNNFPDEKLDKIFENRTFVLKNS